MSASIGMALGETVPPRRGDPNLAPRCGAKARTTGCACRAPAMKNGRCRLHGGKSTGPRTAVGMARMAAAHTTHGRYSAGGAAERADRLYMRTMVARSRLLFAATRHQAHLPPAMATRLDDDPAELRSPKHPSQVAFEASAGSTPCNVSGGGGAGRAMPNWRAAWRAAAVAEAAAQAPWKAAIAFARAAKRAAKTRGTHIDPTKPMGLGAGVGGVAPGVCSGGVTTVPLAGGYAEGEVPTVGLTETPAGPDLARVDINPVYLELALRAAGLRASPGAVADGARLEPELAPGDINPMEQAVPGLSAWGATAEVAAWMDATRAAVAGLLGTPSGTDLPRVDINPVYPPHSLRAAGSRVRPCVSADDARPAPKSGACDINPMDPTRAGPGSGCMPSDAGPDCPRPGACSNGMPPDPCPGGQAANGARLGRPSPTMALGLRGTNLAKTWELMELREYLAGRFGPATLPTGWQAPRALLIGRATEPVGVAHADPIQPEDGDGARG